MKKLLIGLATAVVLIVVVLLAAPFLIPVETYKQQMAEAARDATGRELQIKGDLSLSLLPRLELEAERVTFANAPGASTSEMASLDKLVVQLQIWPLLSGQVQVDRFVLVRPVINLEVDKNGRPNWEFGTGATPVPGGTETAGRAGATGLPEISLGDVRLEDGRITYLDARTGERVELSDIRMSLSLPDLDSPVKAEGSLVWNGEKLTLELDSGNLRGLMAGTATPVDLALDAKPVKLGYRGSVTKAAPLRLDGRIDLDVPSIRDLAAWTGNPIEAEGGGLGPLKIKGQVAATDQSFAFTGAEIALDDMTATGGLSADIGGARPALKGRLDVDRVDLNVYLPPPAEAKAAGGTPGAGQAEPAGWSDEPIALDGLKATNVDFDLTVGELLVQNLKIGRSALAVALKDGLLVLDLKELNLYGGGGTGRLTLDGRGKVPAVAKTFAIESVRAEPFLRDAAGFERLEGTGRMEISITTKGRSQKAMVEALDGRGAVKFTDGAIKGINLAAMVRNVQSAFLDAGSKEAQKTDFAELSGTFTIDKGILRNDDLILLNPLVRLAGKGTSDLPKRTINYRVEPKVVAALEGQGGAAGAKGIAVPVIIQGPWHDLSYRPDLAGLASEALKDPGAVVEGAKETVKQLQEGGAGGIGKALEGLAKPPAEGADQGGGLVPDPKKALKGLFGN